VNDQPDQPDQPDEEKQSQGLVMGPHGLMTLHEYHKMMDQQHAHFEASAHQGVQFFESLSEEQLLTFRGIANAMQSNPKAVVAYYQGLASAYLRWRFGICPACSKKHDDELHKIIDAEKEGDAVHDVDGQTETDEEEILENMRIWNVDFLDGAEDRPMHLRPVYCLANCGAQFPNIGDRMLRKPGNEGCPGCIQKMKTG
jgi:hypothetical protein